MICRNSSDGGKIGTKNRVKLACKQYSLPIFTSDGHPMLLDRLFSQEDVPSDPLQFVCWPEKAFRSRRPYFCTVLRASGIITSVFITITVFLSSVKYEFSFRSIRKKYPGKGVFLAPDIYIVHALIKMCL